MAIWLREKILIIFGDLQAFRRIFINLLSNSVKFTEKGGNIKFSYSLSEDGSLSIEITDTGIGIPQDKLEHVLIPFAQIHGDHELNEERHWSRASDCKSTRRNA